MVWYAQLTFQRLLVLTVDKPISDLRILVVEDEMMLVMLIEDMLSDLGCKSVAAAATVKQALALIDEQVFDAAMLDVNLNGDKSFPVADALALRGVPFMFSSGYGVDGLTEGYRDRPMLKKPYDVRELVHAFSILVPGGAPMAVN
ncbi:MAG: response regulator [Chitinophagales bacterium]|nr:response regulator [Hyphomicrobiales bacterium]